MLFDYVAGRAKLAEGFMLHCSQLRQESRGRISLASADPREKARAEMPHLLASFTDVSPEDCECDEPHHIDPRHGFEQLRGEMG